MATQYVHATNQAWTASPFVGLQTIQCQEGEEVLVHFGGATLPATYEGFPHMHLKNGDLYRYTGAEYVYVRISNNNNTGITQNQKVAFAVTA